MNDISTEKKLELVRQVRSRYHENQCDISNREQILYGRTPIRESYQETPEDITDQKTNSSFSLRLFLALALLVGGIILDKTDTKLAGMTMDQIFQTISVDYYKEIAVWAETISSQIEQLE